MRVLMLLAALSLALVPGTLAYDSLDVGTGDGGSGHEGEESEACLCSGSLFLCGPADWSPGVNLDTSSDAKYNPEGLPEFNPGLTRAIARMYHLAAFGPGAGIVREGMTMGPGRDNGLGTGGWIHDIDVDKQHYDVAVACEGVAADMAQTQTNPYTFGDASLERIELLTGVTCKHNKLLATESYLFSAR